MTHYPHTTAERDRVFNRAVEHIRAATERQYRLITQAEPSFKMTHYNCNDRCIFCPHPALLFRQRRQRYLFPDSAFFLREKLKTFSLCKANLKELKQLQKYENRLEKFASKSLGLGSMATYKSAWLTALLEKMDHDVGQFTLLPYACLELLKRHYDAQYRAMTAEILEFHRDHSTLKNPDIQRIQMAMLTFHVKPRMLYPNSAKWAFMIYTKGRQSVFFRDSFPVPRKRSEGGGYQHNMRILRIPESGPSPSYMELVHMPNMWPVIEKMKALHDEIQRNISAVKGVFHEGFCLSKMGNLNPVVGGTPSLQPGAKP